MLGKKVGDRNGERKIRQVLFLLYFFWLQWAMVVMVKGKGLLLTANLVALSGNDLIFKMVKTARLRCSATVSVPLLFVASSSSSSSA